MSARFLVSLARLRVYPKMPKRIAHIRQYDRNNERMKITSAQFVKSAFRKTDWPDGHWPEIAFLGRSNVGKSSLINSLLLRRGLARTSNTPGRTQSINFFLINDRFYFTDLPGYGYARVAKTMRADRKSTRLNSSHVSESRMPSS